MSLEDHVGDVLAKARRSADLTAVAAAAAAGLSESEYLVLEETGLANRRPDFRQLATVLQLSAEKLQHLAAGWQPQVRELGRWRELRRRDRGGRVQGQLLPRVR